MKTILDFARAKRERQPIVMLTAYDVLMARLVARSDADAILVGDSVAMTVHGFPSTIHATPEMMCSHVAAVRRGAPEIVIVADMPFLSVRRGTKVATEIAGSLVQAGATAVKIEGVTGHEEVVSSLIGSGIPVMGHLGLTPQHVLQFGGYRFQGRSASEADRVREEAQKLEELGAFSLVLECVPAGLAAQVTHERSIATIGIGAGAGTDGQVLVISDMLGMDPTFQPRFARRYLRGHELVVDAINEYARDVRGAKFPGREEILA